VSTRRLTNIQFSQNHAIDGTRVQSAIDDIYERFNNLELEDLNNKHTLQTLVFKCSGMSAQNQVSFPSGAYVGSDRPIAPFIDHAMINVDATSDPAAYRAKGLVEPFKAHSFVWTAATKFLRPITIESVTAHFDADHHTPFAFSTQIITYTGAHGLAVGDKIKTLTNNAYVFSGGAPAGQVNDLFRVVEVLSSTSVRVLWYSNTGLSKYGAAPGLGFDVPNPLTTTNKDGTATLTASAVSAPEDPQFLRILIDCPYLQYSTDRRLNAKTFDRNNFPESMYSYPRLNDQSAATVDMYPGGIPWGGHYYGARALYYHNEDLNIALPAAQAVNFRLAFGHPSLKFCFPSAVPSVTFTITYREQILE
jgi:hypothetical protein